MNVLKSLSRIVHPRSIARVFQGAVFRILALTLLIFFNACGTVLVGTTGDEGIVENPSVRTAGARVEDQSIETKIVVNMKSQEPTFRQSNFHVYSHNGVVLLVGQVASEQLKARATEIASQASAKIKRIHNEFEVMDNTDLLRRGNDTWLASNIKTRMLANDNVPGGRIRVIAENNAIYLMGLVNEIEGDNAANLARNVRGVTKVVKVFEYIN